MFWRVVLGSWGFIVALFSFLFNQKAILKFWLPLFSLFLLPTGGQWYKPCRPMGKAPNAVSGGGTVIFLE